MSTYFITDLNLTSTYRAMCRRRTAAVLTLWNALPDDLLDFFRASGIRSAGNELHWEPRAVFTLRAVAHLCHCADDCDVAPMYERFGLTDEQADFLGTLASILVESYDETTKLT